MLCRIVPTDPVPETDKFCLWGPNKINIRNKVITFLIKIMQTTLFLITFLSLHPGCIPHHIGGTHRQNLNWYDICVVRSLKVRSYTTPSLHTKQGCQSRSKSVTNEIWELLSDPDRYFFLNHIPTCISERSILDQVLTTRFKIPLNSKY